MSTANLPRILVVTPTLGDSRFLDSTIASVAAQPADIFHVIATPAAKVDILQRRYPHTHVVRDAGRQGGIYGALNAGLAAAPERWDWFTYINDDDALLPGLGEVLRLEAERRDTADVVYGDVELVDEENHVLSRITIERTPAWIPALLQQGISPLMQQGMLFRRRVVGSLQGFDTRYRLCADLDFWLRAYAAQARFRSYPIRVAQFRLRSGQLSADTALTTREQTEIVGRHLPDSAPALTQHVARWRYRWKNLPRYVARFRSHGFRTSYQVLQTEGVRR